MAGRCDWCGSSADEMPAYPAAAQGGWGVNPFYSCEKRFYACSESCKLAAENYYAEYQATFYKFAGGMALIFGSAFAGSLAFGYPVFRWAFPAAIALGGILLLIHPHANSFRRDKGGSLKTSLQRSIRDGRIAGFFLVVIAVILAVINFQMPMIIPDY